MNKKLSNSKSIIEIYINDELKRQQNSIELIASENIVSKSLLQAQGSILTNKYAEGYPKKRYYGGCNIIDKIENLAIEKAKALYSSKFANVQPHSGSQANQAVFFGLLNPGDKIVSLSLNCGGHLTHGSTVNISGKWFEVHHYLVDKITHRIDYDAVELLVKKEKPKLIIAGGSAYSRNINFARFRNIADIVGSYLLVDMSHISGIVAAGFHQNPITYADVVTSTTHKTLRGPRGGIILSNNAKVFQKVNAAVFPGIQGGPLMHIIAAKAVAFSEALEPSFKIYVKQMIINAKVLAKELIKRGYNISTGGTDTHLLLVDLRKKGIQGNTAEELLEKVGIICNKNTVPFDNNKPSITSGVRLGTPSTTTRGFKEKEFKVIGNLIADIMDNISNNIKNSTEIERYVFKQVLLLCRKFPIY